MITLLEGPFFKANLHGHSTFSDGNLTPEELKSAYQAKGYSIFAFTDHEHLIDHSDLTDEHFLALTSCEIAIKEFPEQSTLKNYRMRVAHLNFYARDPHNTLTPCYNSQADHYIKPAYAGSISGDGDSPREYSPEGVRKIIGEAQKQGFLVAYNHPVWSLENARDYLEYRGVFAVEIYNHSCAVSGLQEYSPQALDDFLRDGQRVFCTMNDDNHNNRPPEDPRSDSFGGWTVISAPKLTYENVINSLENGNFYCSNGPAIESITAENHTVTIRTSPARKIMLTTAGRRTEAVMGENLTEATFTFRPDDVYFRLTVEDDRGYHAHSQAFETENFT